MIRGIIFAHEGDLDRALENFERSLRLRETSGNKFEIPQSLWYLARFSTQDGKIGRSFDLFKRSLAIAKESNNTFYIAVNLNSIGVTFI